MKKKIIILAIFLFIIIVVTITFALPTFTISKIDLLKDSKINDIKSYLNPDYQIEEPELVANASEDLILKTAYEALSLLLGKPNTESSSNDYFAQLSKYEEFLKYCYNNSNLPLDEDGNISSQYQYYIIEEDETTKDQFNSAIKTLFNLRIQNYENLKILDFYTYDGLKYRISYRVQNAKFKIINAITQVYEDKVGNIDITLEVINNNGIKILAFYSDYDAERGEKVNAKESSETDSLIGKLSYNEVKEHEYTPEEQSQIQNIYSNFKTSIVSLATSNINNAITSNATGFFIREGVIITSWAWFESYLMSNDSLTIADMNNKIYKLDGIISLSTFYDIVVLKLTEAEGTPITKIGYASRGSLIVALSSPTSIGIATNVGKIMGSEDEILKLNLAVTEGEVGSPLFNLKGELAGIISSTKINSTVSYATNTFAFSSLLSRLKHRDFGEIKSYKINALKTSMYQNTISKLEFSQDYDQNLYNQYMKDFNIKNVYQDNIFSIITTNDKLIIKVAFNENNIISKKQYANLYVSKLKEVGYKIIGNNNYQMVLLKENIRINIKYESSYIVITYRGI